jgi:lipopolysaccharide exporter
MLLFRLAEKSLGLVSTVILARLLVPEDFGLVAMAMSIIALVELASSFSFETVLIQKDHPTRAHYDTAWTLNVAFGVGCGLLMMALAIPASHFYAEPRLVAVICVIAAGWALQGLENVGTVDFRRAMDFRREFRFLATKKAVAFVVTVALAVLLRNYWALVIGSLTGRLAGALSSYVMSPYRPRLSLIARRELFRFSGWLLVANVVNFAEMRFAHFFVGRAQGPAALGVFSIGADLASIPTYELSAPINRAAFPGYARLANHPDELRAEVTTVIGVIALLTVPMALGVIGLAEPLITLVMGTKWLPVVPILDILVVGACLRSVMSNYHSAFMAVGRPHLTPVLEGCRVALMVPLTFVLSASHGLRGVAAAQSASIALGLLVSSFVLVRVMRMSWVAFVAQLLRPTLASLAMLATIELTLGSLAGLGITTDAIQFAAGIVVGALSYLAALGAIWLLSGRPAGAEATVLRWVAQYLDRPLLVDGV